jgi:hypothetical protein
MKKFRAHQGDVQVRRIERIPEGAVRLDASKVKPIALGEKSGHMHVVTGDVVETFMMPDGRIIKAVGGDGARLNHVHESVFKGYNVLDQGSVADHPPIDLEPNGVYEMWVQTGYNPYTKQFEKVVD